MSGTPAVRDYAGGSFIRPSSRRDASSSRSGTSATNKESGAYFFRGGMVARAQMNRRGFIQDTLYLLVVLFIMAVTLLAIYYGFGVLSDGLHSGAIPEENLVAFDDNYDRFPSIWDYTFLTLYVVFVIGGMIVSYSLPSNPAFMIVALLVFVILAAIAGFLANTWEAVSEDTVLGLSAQSFPIMNYMISNYILFILVAAALILVAFYAKPESY